MARTTDLCPCGCRRRVETAWTGRRRTYATDACRKREWERTHRPSQAEIARQESRLAKRRGSKKRRG